MLRHSGIAALALAAACGPGDPLQPEPGRHVIVISIDTLRADHLGCYGYGRPTSPNLDELARESLLFERAYSNSNSTAPSHMTLMTGVLPPVHGVRHREAREPSPALPTLAALFQEAGYETTAFADGGYLTAAFGFARGFGRFESRLQRFGDKVDEVLAWLEDRPARPNFLFIHTYGVHAPYLPLAEHDLFTDPDYDGTLAQRVSALQPRRDDRSHAADLEQLMAVFWKERAEFDELDEAQLVGLYDGCIHEVDAGLGRLLEGLDRAGWLDEAWLVVLSDHGEAFREHGTFEHRQLYQEELHVPLLIRPPGGLEAPLRVADVVSLVDLPATLLELAGLSAPPFAQGRALAPLAAPGDRVVHATSNDDDRLRAVIVGDEKLIVRPTGQRERYDLAGDPREGTDLAEQGTEALEEVFRALEEQCRSLRAEVGEPGEAAVLREQDEQDLRALGYVR
ncbi:MAG TPA: sulfatase [Planctomycetota bacterium]|nr:sulfatase [Planctomycetota bacterium]